MSSFFPAVKTVTVPRFGESNVDVSPSLLKPTSQPSPSFREPVINKRLLSFVSDGFKFTDNVVRERGFYSTQYDKKYLHEALDTKGILTSKPFTVSHSPRSRYTSPSHSPDRRHPICHMKPSFRRHKAFVDPLADQDKKFIKLKKALVMQAKQKRSASITEIEANNFSQKKPVQKASLREAWDEYMISLLSNQTANWIVHKKMKDDKNQRRLAHTLRKWYGRRPSNVDLIRDTVSEDGDDDEGDETEKTEPWVAAEKKLLQPAFEIVEDKQDIEKEDEIETAKFRILTPLFKSPPKPNPQIEIDAAINHTAANVRVKPLTDPPVPSLKDLLNPKVGDKIYETDNKFQREWLTGSKQLFRRKANNNSTILMETGNRYKVHMRADKPELPNKWNGKASLPDSSDKIEHKSRVRKYTKAGAQRWQQLPEAIEDSSLTVNDETSLSAALNSSRYSVNQPPALLKVMKKLTKNLAFAKVGLLKMKTSRAYVDEWRSVLHLTVSDEDMTAEDILEMMTNRNAHIRLQAIATVSKFAEDRLKAAKKKKVPENVDPLPPKLVVGLECLLEDTDKRVRSGAAITLFSFDFTSEKASNVLRQTLNSEEPASAWTAAQCFAHQSVCDSEVIDVLLRRYFLPDDIVQQQKASNYLIELSALSSLVHCMLAENLNNPSWASRKLACELFPRLYGQINRDVTNKLVYLMWNDYHSDVRKEAAKTLGKTGHGKDVHDDLCDKLSKGTERQRVACLNRIGYLGLMTARLLPFFLKCFNDDYVTVRCEACNTAGCLKLTDEEVIDTLTKLASHDTVWQVKALAIQALGEIGTITEELEKSLLWSVRYDAQEDVRAEACLTIRKLNLSQDAHITVLQERFMVEESELVKAEIEETLKNFGIEATEDTQMVTKIKSEVHRLCNLPNLINHISQFEDHMTLMENRIRLIEDPILYKVPNWLELETAITQHNIKDLSLQSESREISSDDPQVVDTDEKVFGHASHSSARSQSPRRWSLEDLRLSKHLPAFSVEGRAASTCNMILEDTKIMTRRPISCFPSISFLAES